MDTSRVDGVKAPHDGTPRSHLLHRVAFLLGHDVEVGPHELLDDGHHAVGHAVALLRDLGADGGRDGGGARFVGLDLRLFR